MQAELATLTPFERFAFKVVRWFQSGTGLAIAKIWQRALIIPFVGLIMGRRVKAYGLERLATIPPNAPILLVSNHRTFFDQFVLGWYLLSHGGLRHRVSFPVRGNFFYETPLGLLLAVGMSGASMYPPFFRSGEKMPFNKYALSVLVDQLKKEGELVGFHPEGTRNKTDDPYTLLPAQPGVGEVALKARPVVVPAFINGLSNSFWTELKAAFTGRAPVVAVYGEPVDLSGWPAETRLSHHKKCADAFTRRIAALGEEEKKLRTGG
jgi:1-acyl-sn-glycerol-3-phosphate acyltransferase